MLKRSHKTRNRYIFTGLILLTLVFGGLFTAFFLSRQTQDVRNQAAVDKGLVKIAVTPNSQTADGQIKAGEPVLLDISVNTG